ncbi:hypothetical protein QBC40DRAFT_302303 [Triangularia verruculosa]|uniref:Uncharacterized protein n=1 Tax=Triangularia verruculosa TaxID=2587418 RepID=A0AAN7AQ04_9PEZI|nr:hypothetical protein QBC40DRAFT_302303 [Triangularia verruculosa]
MEGSHKFGRKSRRSSRTTPRATRSSVYCSTRRLTRAFWYGTQTGTDYVGYISAAVKKSRTDWVKRLNFGGTTDWAVDLMEFVSNDDDGGSDDGSNPDDKCSPDDKTYSSPPSRDGEYMRWFLMEPEYAATTGRTYITIVNLTPHPFTLQRTSKYQMDEVGANPVDTNGEAYYNIGDTGKKFKVRVTAHIPDTYPWRIVFGLSGMGKGQREQGAGEGGASDAGDYG